jgi:hypothetical protein
MTLLLLGHTTLNISRSSHSRIGRDVTVALRPTVERVGSFAGFGLDVLGDDRKTSGFGKPGDGGALGFDPQTGSLLALGGDSQVGDDAFHTNSKPTFAVCVKSFFGRTTVEEDCGPL